MNTKRVVISVAIFSFALSLSTGCIKPPPDKEALGDEVSVNDKNAALAQAMAGLDQDKAFHVSDNGVILVVDNVMTNTMVRETHQDQVTKIDDQYITYTDYVVETKDFGTAKIKRKGTPASTPIPGASPNSPVATATPTAAAAAASMPAVAANAFLFLPRSLDNLLRFVKNTVSGIFSHVSVQASSASASASTPASASGETGFNLTANDLSSPFSAKDHALKLGLDSLIAHVLRAHGLEVMDDPSLASTLESGLAGSPTPPPDGSAAPTTAPTPSSTSRYFGLKVTQENFLTKNCAQLSDCKVPATHIEYAELKTSPDGSTRKFRWYYEISTQVPGLFTLMEQCLSTVIIQNGVQYPFRECIHVSDFRWGQAQN